jgi:hypothetical protein
LHLSPRNVRVVESPALENIGVNRVLNVLEALSSGDHGG